MITENIDYKALYELEKIKNLELTEKNNELEKYKTRYLRKCSYGESIEFDMEEAEKLQRKRKNTKK